MDAKYFSKRLLTALEVLLKNPLTVVEAPTGYGKTVAVKEFLSQAPVNLVITTAQETAPESFWPDFCQNLGGLPQAGNTGGTSTGLAAKYSWRRANSRPPWTPGIRPGILNAP